MVKKKFFWAKFKQKRTRSDAQNIPSLIFSKNGSGSSNFTFLSLLNMKAELHSSGILSRENHRMYISTAMSSMESNVIEQIAW